MTQPTETVVRANVLRDAASMVRNEKQHEGPRAQRVLEMAARMLEREAEQCT